MYDQKCTTCITASYKKNDVLSLARGIYQREREYNVQMRL